LNNPNGKKNEKETRIDQYEKNKEEEI